jgi:topoisomerase-4 subunit A
MPEKEYKVKYISGMYKKWFLDYASYVILERAVPHLADGLKPVQRRILHSMKRMDDGRYNKVANIIGHTMQFHPHGDASIGDALVQLGQKELLIDKQGNWGNIYTGDNAAASRYIEARLSKFALDVVFNPKTTKWKQSYDGRNKEPLNLPVKFPLLLAQGVEGIAVGLASKIMPHNFIELIDASIKHLKDEEFELYPDFLTGGYVDVSNYNDGLRGGKIRIRAKIEKKDKKTLIITELPFGKTTNSIIDSILSANEKGKIKIKKIEDNTADKVEILVHLFVGVSSDKTIDALYAVTDCEISVSPNSTVITQDKPQFLGVREMLKISTENTLNLLKIELEIRKSELLEAWHLSSLEKIFIENRIYRDIEECETWESIIETIDTGLEPFKAMLKRPVTRDDITKLTEIKIKRISKYDSFKADRHIKSIEEEIKEINYNLAHIVDYTIAFYEKIKQKHGKGRERKTEIRNFEEIHARKVVIRNLKFYVNYQDGFAGTSLRQDEYIADCSDMDDIIIFRKDGSYIVKKVEEKLYIGKDVNYINIWKNNDERTIYNVIYRDSQSGFYYMKRFFVKSITRDKEYNLTKGNSGSKVIWLTANPNGEAETIKAIHRPRKRLRKKFIEVDFSKLPVRGRRTTGNLVTKLAIQRIVLKEEGISTLGGRNIWFDRDVLRLNAENRGELLGEFESDDKVLSIYKSGEYRLTGYELSNRYESDIYSIQKYDPTIIFSVVFFDADQEYYYLKRFEIEEIDKKVSFIGENSKSKLILLTQNISPKFEIKFGGKNSNRDNETIDANSFISVKSWRARGKRLSIYEIDKITEIESNETQDDKQINLEESKKIESEKIKSENSETKKENIKKSSDKDTVTNKETFEEPEFEVIQTDEEGNQTVLNLM